MSPGALALSLALMGGCGATEVYQAATGGVAAKPAAMTPMPAAASAAPTALLERPAEDSLIGRWEGRGTQSDGQEWGVVFELERDEGVCGRVSYPEVGCSGVLHCRSGGEGVWREVDERIEQGPCIDGGTFQVRVFVRTGGGRSLEWRWGAYDVSMTAKGVLQEQDFEIEGD